VRLSYPGLFPATRCHLTQAISVYGTLAGDDDGDLTAHVEYRPVEQRDQRLCR
jgi:hypothetical protein